MATPNGQTLPQKEAAVFKTIVVSSHALGRATQMLSFVHFPNILPTWLCHYICDFTSVALMKLICCRKCMKASSTRRA